ncbi:MAG TPA: hypothetical protein VFA65_02610 [Bryobacteraceae bacterium]|nr:hypothetical protein [Bryobacteraceae bacterium]
MKTIRLITAFTKLTPFQLGVLLFTLAFLVRLAVIVYFRPYHDLGRYELERTAISLANTGVYGNPYAVPTGPTAHVSPGYTLILATLFHLFGTGIRAEVIKEILAVSVTSLQIALLPAVAGAIGIRQVAGLIAGLVMALYPARPLVEIDGDWETPYMALSLMLVAVLAAQHWRRRDLRIVTAIRHGIYWGIVLLFIGALLPLFITFVVVEAFWERRRLVKYFQFALIEIVVVAACLTPWIIRNYFALGAPVITRTNAGIELRISNNDLAAPDQRENYLHGLFNRYHPLQSPTEAEKVRELGEVEYNRRALLQAKLWIRTHPTRFFELTLGRIRCFWFYTDPTSRIKTLFCWLVNVLGFTGLAVALAQQRLEGKILGLIALIYPLPNYLVHVGLRQSYPVEWLMLLLGISLLARALTPRSAGEHALAAAH